MSEQEGECHHCNEPQADGYCWWCGKRQPPLNDSRIPVAAREGLAALVEQMSSDPIWCDRAVKAVDDPNEEEHIWDVLQAFGTAILAARLKENQ